MDRPLFALAAGATLFLALPSAFPAFAHFGSRRLATAAPVAAPPGAPQEQAGEHASILRGTLAGIMPSVAGAHVVLPPGTSSVPPSHYDREFANLVADMHNAAQSAFVIRTAWDLLTLSGPSTDPSPEMTMLDPEFGTISLNSRSRWAQARISSQHGGCPAVDPVAAMRRAMATSLRVAWEKNSADAVITLDYPGVPINATNAPLEGFISTSSVIVASPPDDFVSAPVPPLATDSSGTAPAPNGGSSAVVDAGFGSSQFISANPVNLPIVLRFAPAPQAANANPVAATSVSTASLVMTAPAAPVPQHLTRSLAPTFPTPPLSAPIVTTTATTGTADVAPAGAASQTLFVANYDSNTIEQYTPPFGTGTTFSSASQLNGPGSLAFDSAGNLYVVNYGGGNMLKYASTGGILSSTPTTFVASGVSEAFGMAFDSTGNLYVALQTNSILKFTATGGVLSSSLTTFTTSGLNVPGPLAFDRAGNLYVSNQDGNNIEKFAATGGVLSSAGTVFASGLNYPGGLAFDRAGDLFVANSDGNNIIEYPVVGGVLSSTGTIFDPSTGYSWGLAFDNAGDLFVGHTSTITEYAATGGVLSNTATTFASSGFNDGYGMAFTVPEPGSAALWLTGLLAVAARRRR